LAEADKAARMARRAADTAVADANRALSRAEADRNLAESKLDSSGLAVTRHEEEAMSARKALTEAEATPSRRRSAYQTLPRDHQRSQRLETPP